MSFASAPCAFLSAAVLLLACGEDGGLRPGLADGSSTSTDDGGGGGGGGLTDITESSSTMLSTSTAASTGPASECGNGIVEDGEECDDHDLDDDDECSSICTIPFEVLWTATYDGGEADAASHALFDAAGNLYVVGSTQVPGHGHDLWLRQYTPAGSEGWTWTYDGVLHGDDFGRRLAWHDSGDLMIVGSETTTTQADVLVIRLDIADQTPAWIRRHDGPGSGPEPIDDTDIGNAIAVDAEGNVLVAATIRVDGHGDDVWLRQYDAEGNEGWTYQYDDPDVHGADSPVAVVPTFEGNVYLVGNSEIAPGVGQASMRLIDAEGNELHARSTADVVVTDAVLDFIGNLVLVGLDVARPNDIDMWAAKLDNKFFMFATTDYGGPAGLTDAALGVALGTSGDLFVTGYVTMAGEQSNAWIGRYTHDLSQRWWSDGAGNSDPGLTAQGRGVAVSADDSRVARVAVVGLEGEIGQDTNIWIRVYGDYPAPP